MSYHVSFYSCIFSSFSIAITSLGEERTNLSAFRTFVRFVLVWICRFPLPLGVWEGMRFVIVALPGLFSFPLFFYRSSAEKSVIVQKKCLLIICKTVGKQVHENITASGVGIDNVLILKSNAR